MAATATPLPRPDVEALIIKEIFTNANGKIDGDRLQRVLLYMATSAPNILTDGLLPGNNGGSIDLTALLRAIAAKADRSELVTGLAGKEPKFNGLATSDLAANKAAYANLLLKQLLVKIVNALGSASDTPALSAAFLSRTPTTSKLLADRALTAALATPGAQLVWVLPAAGAAARTTVQLAANGVVADGTLNSSFSLTGNNTDNAPALLAMRNAITAATSFAQQPAYLFVGPPGGGVMTYGKNSWAAGLRDAIYDLNGGTWIPNYTGTYNYSQRTVNNGELGQTNLDTDVGSKQHLTALLIDTAQPGATSFRVKDASLLDPNGYFPGAWVVFYSDEGVLGIEAYPPGCQNVEYRKLNTVDYETGAFTTYEAITKEHRDDYPENPFTAGGGSGRARIVTLSDPRALYSEYTEFRNGTMLAGPADADGAIAWVGLKVLFTNIVTKQGGTATESEETIYDGGDFGAEFEDDKLNVRIKRRNTRVRGPVTNGNGVQEWIWEGGRSDKTIQVAGRLTKIDGTEFPVQLWASTYTTDRGANTFADQPAVRSYAFHHTDQFIFVGAISVGADNNTLSYLDPALYGTLAVQAVSNGMIVVPWDGTNDPNVVAARRAIRVGTPMYLLDGSIGGRCDFRQFVPDNASCTTGKFYYRIGGVTPVVGQVFEYSNVDEVIDTATYTMLTPQHPARLWSMDNLRWKGNTGSTPNAPGSLTITLADLYFVEGHAEAYFALRGKPRRITATSSTASAGQVLIVGTNQAQQSESAVEIVSFSLATTGTRYAGTAGASSSMEATETTLLGLNEYHLDAFGRFHYKIAVVLKGITRAELPTGFSLTFDTDYF